jgi:hypothetical protein
MGKMVFLTFALFSLALIDSGYCQEKRDNDDFHLKILLFDVIEKKCHLTELSNSNPVVIKKEKVEIKISFDNRTLRRFWSPEVAVQYIFDAALQPILAAICNDPRKRFDKLKVFTFYVDIRPHDIPPMLVFKISKDVYLQYSTGTISKESLYNKISITSAGEKYNFNAHKAVDIE